MAINFLNNVDYNQNQLFHPTIENQASDALAGTPVDGQLYYNTSATPGLKVGENGAWVFVGGGVESITTANSTFIDLVDSGTAAVPILTASLSASNTPDATKYLRGDNAWEAISAIPGTYTWSIQGDAGGPTAVASGDAIDFAGGTNVTTDFSGTTLTINSTDQFVGTVTSVATTHAGNAFTASIGNVATVNPSVDITMNGSSLQYVDGLGDLQTFPAIPQGDITDVNGGTYITTLNSAGPVVTVNHDATTRADSTSTDAPAFGATFEAVTSVTTNPEGHVTAIDVSTVTIPAAPADPTITLTGDVTGSGTTSIATTISAGAVDFAMLNPTDVITEAEGIENNDNDTTIPTSAAVKAYADSLIVGGLIYQGGYNAATNTPDLTTSPNSILKGWTYTVTADGAFFGEQLRVGDVLIAEVNDPSAIGDWTTVQNNIDLASLTQVGIGNVNAEPAGNLGGIAVSYTSGTAKVGLGIAALGVDPLAETPADYFIPIYNSADDENKKVASSDLLAAINSVTSKAYTITDTATITYPFTLTAATQNDTIIQLVDTVTNETVYADVDRISTTQATITFASTPTNSVRVLVQKIG